MKRRSFILSGMVIGGSICLGNNLLPLKIISKKTEKKWAVLFGTKYGSTRDAATWISEGMGGIADVVDSREKPDLKHFDYLIIGSGIYGGKLAPALEEYLNKHIKEIKGKIKGFFIVCGAGGERGAGYVKLLEDLCQVQVQMKKVFSGRITKRLLSPEDLKGLEGYYKRINKPFEDYDQLSRKECLKWGDTILKSQRN